MSVSEPAPASHIESQTLQSTGEELALRSSLWDASIYDLADGEPEISTNYSRLREVGGTVVGLTIVGLVKAAAAVAYVPEVLKRIDIG